MATIDGTLNQDTYITGYQPTTNQNGNTLLLGDHGGSDQARGLFKFTLPANPGSATITDVVVKLYLSGGNGTSAVDFNIYNGTSTPATTWVDSQATWNIYKTSTNWTASGGFSDFVSTILGKWTSDTSIITGYKDFAVQGSGAINPLSLNWGDTVNFMVRAPSSAGTNRYFDSSSQANPPKITVTYTVGSTSHIKSADGILIANIKSADGILIANIKSWNGITN